MELNTSELRVLRRRLVGELQVHFDNLMDLDYDIGLSYIKATIERIEEYELELTKNQPTKGE